MLARIDDRSLDAGPGKPGTERFCAVTREVRPVSDMIRFVIGPDGAAVPDLKRKLPGRGIWITATRAALTEAVKRKVFARGFKAEVKTPADLVALTERLLERAVLDALAIAGKAGHAITGFTKVETAMGEGHIVALLHAADAAPDGVRKMNNLARRLGVSETIATVDAFASAQLDLALGRSNVVHAALLAGPASETFLRRFSRLERFRTGNPDERNTGNARRGRGA